jgi:hypothetical protein
MLPISPIPSQLLSIYFVLKDFRSAYSYPQKSGRPWVKGSPPCLEGSGEGLFSGDLGARSCCLGQGLIF